MWGAQVRTINRLVLTASQSDDNPLFTHPEELSKIIPHREAMFRKKSSFKIQKDGLCVIEILQVPNLNENQLVIRPVLNKNEYSK